MYSQHLDSYLSVSSGADTWIIILRRAAFEFCFLMQSFPSREHFCTTIGVVSAGISVWATLKVLLSVIDLPSLLLSKHLCLPPTPNDNNEGAVIWNHCSITNALRKWEHCTLCAQWVNCLYSQRIRIYWNTFFNLQTHRPIFPLCLQGSWAGK